jgi:choline dehydrogenase-like flavoprotein
MGLRADYGNIVYFLRSRFDASVLAPIRPLRPLLNFTALAARTLFGRAHIFVGLLEDLPDAGNRVVFDPANPRALRYEYRTSPALRARRKAVRTSIRRRFGASSTFFLNREAELNTAHCCGTLRYGTDPATSVLDASCRAHQIDNLYVADASFMPTSNGVNPSLTIAANALRVGDAVAARLGLQSESGRIPA